MARDDLQNAGAEAFEGLGVAVSETGLGLVDGEADAVPHRIRETLQVGVA